MNLLKITKKKGMRLGLGISCLLLIVTVLQMFSVEHMSYRDSIIYAAEKEVEFVDKEFEKAIYLRRDILYPERRGQPLSRNFINNLEFVVIDEDFYPETYEDIYLFTNALWFHSWDQFMTVDDLVEIDRYIKSIDINGSVSGTMEYAYWTDDWHSSDEEMKKRENEIELGSANKPIYFKNPLTTKIINDLTGVEDLRVKDVLELLTKGIELKNAHFIDCPHEDIVKVLNELIDCKYINVIHYSSLSLDQNALSKLKSKSIVFENGVIRKKAKYEDQKCSDLMKADQWYNSDMSFLIENKIMQGFIQNEKKYAKPHDKLTNAEAIKIVAKALEFQGDLHISKLTDVPNDEIWYNRFYKALGITPEKYEPNKIITRYELANLFNLVQHGQSQTQSLDVLFENAKRTFKDWEQIPDEYKASVAHLLELEMTSGIMNRQGDISYHGDDKLTRAMMATFIRRLIELD